MYTSLKELIMLADISFESKYVLDVIFIKDKFLQKPGYLEIYKTKDLNKTTHGTCELIYWKCNDSAYFNLINTVNLINLLTHIAGSIEKEKLDKIDKNKSNVIFGRSFIFDKAFRTYIEIMN